MLTYNGNEMMLQNDMGNTLIQDSATGNIMGLNPGFIPTGIKEHGGIMYITSVGKDANGNPIGEIGTIPSPIIRDIYKDKITYTVNNFIPIGLGDPLTITHKLYPADKFIVNLDMQVDTNDLVGTLHYKESSLSGSGGRPSGDPSDIVLSRKVVRWDGNSSSLINLYTPLISYSNPEVKNVKIPLISNIPIEVPLFSTKGIYSLDMYSTNVNGSKKVSGPLISPQWYNDNGINTESKYWYLHTNKAVFPKDLFEATLNKSLKQFPSSNKPGQLAVKLTPEKIGEFGMLPRKNDPKNTPITVKWNHPVTNYKSFFPGFYYSTDSGIYIDYLKNIKVIDESTGKEVSLHNPYSGLVNNIRFNFTGSTVQTQPPANPSFSKDLNVWNRTYGIPQTQSGSKESSNYFILSYAADINDHTETNFVSSDVSMEDYPHTGLFYANLGAKYNNWYRLELDYYDQYDNLQGSFSSRFNPYINDTFGTNLDITGVEMVDGIVMGSKKTYNSTINDFTLNSTSQYTELFSHSYPSINNTSWKGLGLPNQDIVSLYQTGNKGFYCHGTSEKTFQEYSRIFTLDFKDDTAAYAGKIQGQSDLKTFLYVYNSTDQASLTLNDSNQTYRNYVDILWGDTPVEPQIVFAGNKNNLHNKAEIVPARTDWDWEKNVGILYVEYQSKTYSEVFSNSGPATTIAPISVPMNITGSEYYLTKSIPNMVSVSIDKIPLREIILGGDIKALARPAVGNIPLYLHFVRDLSFIWSDKEDEIFMLYLTSKNSSPRIRMMTALNQGINSGGLDMSMDLTPAYKITPYFLLTGTADSTSSVYPRRFVNYKKESGQFKYIDMPYEYNLEKVSMPFNITKSDIEIEESSYLKKLEGYNQKDLGEVNFTLDAGIYTLNITGVPNNLNQDATIMVNDTKLAIHTAGTLRTTDKGTISNKFYFYQPVVFILSQRTDVKIQANALNAFQEIGLYKVNTVDINQLPAFVDMYTKAGGEAICTYQKYMNNKGLFHLQDTIAGSKRIFAVFYVGTEKDEGCQRHRRHLQRTDNSKLALWLQLAQGCGMMTKRKKERLV